MKTMDELMMEQASGLIPAGPRSLQFIEDVAGIYARKAYYVQEYAAHGRPYPARSKHYDTPAAYDSVLLIRDCCRDVSPYDDGLVIGFGPYNIDPWAALVFKYDSVRNACLCAAADDTYYMEGICRIMLKSDAFRERAYADAMHVYDHCCVGLSGVGAAGAYEISRDVLDYIRDASAFYGEYQDCVRRILLHIYYGMIAEERKFLKPGNGGEGRWFHSFVGRVVKMVAIRRIYDAVCNGTAVDIRQVCNQDRCRPAQELLVDASCLGIFTERALLLSEAKRSKASEYACSEDAYSNFIISSLHYAQALVVRLSGLPAWALD